MEHRPSLQETMDTLRQGGVHAGGCPEWIHTNAYGVTTDSVAAEVAPDFMFWPSGHRFGWYFEPSYEYKFGSGHEHSLGITGGLLIGIP